ncbi:MAG TPA: WYL domain-containing protein [Allosphingosinicella sp.]|jgi:hypothetical protein
MNVTPKRQWPQNRRFEFIEWKLYWEGSLNRSDLEDAFEISTPQASVDLRNYRAKAEGNLDYDPTGKGFRPTPGITPRFLRVSADRLLLQLRAYMTGALARTDLWFKSMPPSDMAPDVVRHVEPDCLRRVLQAMRRKEALDVNYQSMTSSRWRRIAPHALAFDGHRWHVRAWACDREDFRDFVLTRIEEIGGSSRAEFNPEDDIEWETRTTLFLEAHPGLTEEQSRAVQSDFGMVDGRRSIEVRLSLAYYFIRRLNLDLPDLPAARAQIRLANLDQVAAQAKAAREATLAAIAARREARAAD